MKRTTDHAAAAEGLIAMTELIEADALKVRRSLLRWSRASLDYLDDLKAHVKQAENLLNASLFSPAGKPTFLGVDALTAEPTTV